MAVTTVELLAIAPEFSSESSTRLNAFLDIARLFVNPRTWGNKTDTGVIYYAAHLLSTTPTATGSTGATTTRGPITQEKVGDISTSYGGASTTVSSSTRTSFSASSYGQIFEQMMKTLVITPICVNGRDLNGNLLPYNFSSGTYNGR